MILRLTLTIALFLCISSGANARIILRSYEMKGKAYSQNRELIRNGEFVLTQRGNTYRIQTDSVGNYSLRIYDYYPNNSDVKRNHRRITIQYGEEIIHLRDKSKKYYRRHIEVKEKDLQF